MATTTYVYTGTLSDIGLGNLSGALPEMTVRPRVSAFGPDGIVSDVRVPVALAGGAFTMTLIPSGDLVPADGGRGGVPYVLEVGRFELADDLTKVWHGTEVWAFSAAIGGGNVGGMSGLPFALNDAWVSLDPPPSGFRGWWLYSPAVGQTMPLDDPLIGELRMVR